MKKVLKWAGIALVAIVVLALIFGEEEPAADKAETAEVAKESPKPKETKTPKPKFDGTAYAKQIEDDFLESMGGRPIEEMCSSENAYTHWGCFYDGVSASHKGTLWVELNTDGGWSNADQKQLSEEAARHWFNFVGPKHKDLDTIVVKVNGIDHNHYRGSFPGADL